LRWRVDQAVALGAFLVTGCTHWHLERNAPGRVNLSAPPVNLADERPERPEDPGERMAVFSPGLNAGLGGHDWGRFFAPVGLETSILLGQDDQSHYEDAFVISVPRRSLGINLGVQRSAGGRMLTYGEAQIFFMPYGIAAGWALLPYESQQGPQTTLFFGPLYFRATHLMGHDTELSAGLFFKFPMAIVWSR
jgi:hypothetical protein